MPPIILQLLDTEDWPEAEDSSDKLWIVHDLHGIPWMDIKMDSY